MTLSGNQPYFIPYFPYWQLIAASDVFIVSDDYDYIKAGWINRNRILVHGKVQYLRLDVQHESSSRLIKDKRLVPFSAAAKLRTIEMAYHGAPFFDEGYALMANILDYSGDMLMSLLEKSIRCICDYLGITTPLILSSSLEGNNMLKREERIYDFCRRFGADRYINPIGGQALYSKEEFRRKGLELGFIKSAMPAYDQTLRLRFRSYSPPAFVPGLSVLDAIMFNSRGQLHDMLDKYSII